MELSAEVATSYCGQAFDQMVAVADRLGDDLVNARPPGKATNSVASLIVHCCGVAEFWLGHVALGRETSRDRDAEFRAEATVAELRDRIGRVRAQVASDIAAIDADGVVGSSVAEGLPSGAGAASIVLHVIEELFQHLGHMDLTADVLLASAR